MEEVIVLINFNTYLGGGETLMVRYSSFLQERNIPFLAFCIEGSYIHKDLTKRNILGSNIRTFKFLPDYYYLPETERNSVLHELRSELKQIQTVRFLTFCMREVYTVFALSKSIQNCSATHLVLHIEDDKYVGQTLLDKFNLKFFKSRKFNNTSTVKFNQKLMMLLNRKHSLISMASIISKFWNKEFGIDVPLENTVPLPSFKEQAQDIEVVNNCKILWIGRIVDFKIPSIIQMMDFVKSSPNYSLTIVGNGDMEMLKNHMKTNNINESKVDFIGQVDYNKLPNIIKEHSIGYAMGTSLVELAQFRIPVIIALASFDYKPLSKMICGGLFFDKDLGCDGSELMMTPPDKIRWTIPSMVAHIEDNYKSVAEACYQFAKTNYSEHENFERYTDIIKNAELLTKEDRNIKVPSASRLRRKLFHYFNK